MKSTASCFLAKWAIALLATTMTLGILRADNAVPIAVREAGEIRVLLFSHEKPIRAGLVNLSLMAVDMATGRPLGDLRASGTIHPVSVRDDSGSAWVPTYCRIDQRAAPGGGMHVEFGASESANPFAREVALVLARSGEWRLDVALILPGETPTEIAFPLEVAAARPAIVQYWPWFAVIPLAIGIFAWSRPSSDQASSSRADSTSRAI